MTTPTIVWFRQDLRLADNPALQLACKRGGAVIPVYIWAPAEEGDWAPGSASRYWLYHLLVAFSRELGKLGSKLIVRTGDSLEELDRLVNETGAGAVYWNRRYEPTVIRRDAGIKKRLRDRGLMVDSCNGSLLFEPSRIMNKKGAPFRVFTPFWRHCRALGEPSLPLTAPRRLQALTKWPASVQLESLQLTPSLDWPNGIRESWHMGTAGARKALRDFLHDGINDYPRQRDFPAINGVSRLSPRLHFGEISPRQIWVAVRNHEAKQGNLTETKQAEVYLRQLGWREFSHHLLFYFPHTSEMPLNDDYQQFPWRWNTEQLQFWKRGQTGYPIVDAGMRELWYTGYMHNRVRMITASFLVKDLLVHWLEGARWFWDTLVDADLANNTLGWQWAAGCGADAAPYFRILNPTRQAERFDPDGAYIRHWVPELKKLKGQSLLTPWKADPSELKQAGVVLGETYPLPVVDHGWARTRALEAFETIKKK